MNPGAILKKPSPTPEVMDVDGADRDMNEVEESLRDKDKGASTSTDEM